LSSDFAKIDTIYTEEISLGEFALPLANETESMFSRDEFDYTQHQSLCLHRWVIQIVGAAQRFVVKKGLIYAVIPGVGDISL